MTASDVHAVRAEKMKNTRAEILCAVTLLDSKLAHSRGKLAVIMEKITDEMGKQAWRNAHVSSFLPVRN